MATAASALAVRRGVAIATIAFVVVAAFVVAAAGEPDPDAQVASSTTNIASCIMGCATEVTGCATACASDPGLDTPTCAMGCVQSNLSCLADCGTDIVPSPPAA